jgi:hypothetical protein
MWYNIGVDGEQTKETKMHPIINELINAEQEISHWIVTKDVAANVDERDGRTPIVPSRVGVRSLGYQEGIKDVRARVLYDEDDDAPYEDRVAYEGRVRDDDDARSQMAFLTWAEADVGAVRVQIWRGRWVEEIG